MKTGEHFVGKGSFSLEHMNSGLETVASSNHELKGCRNRAVPREAKPRLCASSLWCRFSGRKLNLAEILCIDGSI